MIQILMALYIREGCQKRFFELIKDIDPFLLVWHFGNVCLVFQSPVPFVAIHG